MTLYWQGNKLMLSSNNGRAEFAQVELGRVNKYRRNYWRGVLHGEGGVKITDTDRKRLMTTMAVAARLNHGA